MKKLRRKVMLTGVIASAVGVALAGAAGITVHAVVKAKKKKKAMAEAAEAEALITELEEQPVPEESCAAEIDL